MAMSSKRFHILLVLATVVNLIATSSIAADVGQGIEGDEYETASEKRQRHAAKAWYLQKIQLRDGQIKLPFSPVSLAVAFFSFYYLYNILFGGGGGKDSKVYCEASHILIMDHSKETKEKLLDFQKAIQSDVLLFAKHAKKHSACPSGKSSGGNLGRFGPGTMAPPFDKVCFDPATPMQTTVGPVQTNFGWHLIYIHERRLPVD